MCEKDLLVSYLYDDVSREDRARFESHLRGCAACRDELKALGAVRADLATWAPPVPDFGFRMINARAGRDAAEREVIRPLVPSWRAWWTPAAGFAAAAVLVLAAASALARVEVHSGPDGVTVRTGWSAFAPAAATAAGGSYGATSPTSRPGDIHLSSAPDGDFLAGLERRLAALEAASSRDSGLRNASTLSARSSDEEIIRRVRELVAQSEDKQQGELALRISQVIRDIDTKRAADLNAVRQGLGRIDANVTEEAAMGRELRNYILTKEKQK